MSRRQLALVPWLTAALAVAACPAAPAQVAVVKVGDTVPGFGAVFQIEDVAVDDGGSWMVRASTENGRVVIVNGAVALFDGQFLPDASATLNGFADVDLEGQLGSLLGLSDGDLGAFVGTELVARDDGPCTAPELPSGSVFFSLLDCRSGGDGVLGLRGQVDEPGIPLPRVVVVVHVDETGRVLSETAPLIEKMQVGSTTLTNLTLGPTWDVNASDDAISTGLVAAPLGQQQAVVLGRKIVAQQGMPSPVAGRNWLTLFHAVSLDDSGGAAFIGSLDGDASTSWLLVRDGVKVVQQGDPLPLDDDLTVSAFGSWPIGLGNNGNLLYFASWEGAPLDQDTGLFLNDRMAVREGVTTVGGVRIDELVASTNGYDLSPDGEWLIFRGRLVDGTIGAFLLEVGPWVSVGHGLAGTDGRTPMLVGAGSLVPGSAGALELSNAKPLAAATLFAGLSTLEAPFKGGTLVPSPLLLLPLATSATGGFNLSWSQWPGGLPAGTKLYLQTWVADAGGPAGLSASNALVATAPGL